MIVSFATLCLMTACRPDLTGGTSSGAMDSMDVVDVFIRHCQTLCQTHQGYDIAYQTVGAQICAACKTLPSRVHPMITEIGVIARYLGLSTLLCKLQLLRFC